MEYVCLSHASFFSEISELYIETGMYMYKWTFVLSFEHRCGFLRGFWLLWLPFECNTAVVVLST